VTRRVLLVAYFFPPIAGGGVQRIVKFVRYLPEFGYEPVVLTGAGGTADRWSPEDASLAAEIGDVEIHRVPGPEPLLSTGWRRRGERILGLETAFARWWTRGVLERGREIGRSVDVVLGELVPYLTGEPVARLAREAGVPWVADLQDPWALDEMWHYPTGLHRRRDLRTMRRVLGAADAIVMNTPEASARVARKFPDLAARLAPAIPNGLDSADLPDTPPPGGDGKFRIVHSGYLHTEHGLEHRRTRFIRELLGGTPVRGLDILTRSHVFLLEAIDRLLAREPGLVDTIEVHLAGVVSETDRAIAERSPVARLHGYMSHPETIELLRSAELLFLPMHDLPPGVRAGLVPGKTYEYLGIGKPILAAVPEGDARDLLREAGNALVCSPSDVAAMCELIEAEIARWRSGRPTPSPLPEVVARYERRRQAGLLAEVLDSVERDTRARRWPGELRQMSAVSGEWTAGRRERMDCPSA
jgi:glycosyltransferase involved in cell wall biosynthesis